MFNKTVLVALVLCEYIAILLLAFIMFDKIKNKKFNPFKRIYVTRISKQEVSTSTSSNHLRYFYDLIPNQVIKFTPDWLESEAIHTINSDGIHDRYEYKIEKSIETYRIMTLGDSFTYGSYINTESNYSERLEDLLNKKTKCNNIKKFEVINLGLHGADAEYSIERFILKGKKYNPDLVIWFINSWNLERLNDYIIPMNSDSKYKSYEERLKAIYQVYGGYQKVLDHQKIVFKRLSENFSKILFIISFNTLRNEHSKMINEIVSDRKDSYFDGSLLANYWKDDSLRLAYNHPTPLAHQKIAQTIFNFLTDNILKNTNNCLTP